MPIWLAVALGGALGSVARYQTTVWMRMAAPAFPWGTLIVNVAGGGMIGFLAAGFAARGGPEWLRLGLITGVLGGYTTFSAFSLETMELWQRGTALAIGNVLLNLVLSLSACLGGLWLGRTLFGP